MLEDTNAHAKQRRRRNKSKKVKREKKGEEKREEEKGEEKRERTFVTAEAPPAAAAEAPEVVEQGHMAEVVKTDEAAELSGTAEAPLPVGEDEAAHAKQALEGSNVEGQAFVRCDLCNEKIYEEEQLHHQSNHAALKHWCSHVLAVEAPALLTAPLLPEHQSALGLFVLESVAELDKGPAAFGLIQRALEQLNGVAQSVCWDATAFLFGSCVASGSWDGVSDADFTVLEPRLLERFMAGGWDHNDERRSILRLASALRNSGFLHSELEVVIKTRVPVVKRAQNVRPPLLLPDLMQGYKIEYCFLEEPDRGAYNEFTTVAMKRKIGVMVDGPDKLTLHFNTAQKALRYYRTTPKGLGGIVKTWKSGHQLPDIFSIDFDVSCRPLGVRNSWFMRQYLSQRPVARAGLAFLKRWSKRSGINNGLRGYLTSYAVTILWVYYLLRRGVLQYVDPALIHPVPSTTQQEVPYIPLLGDEWTGGASMESVSESSALAELREELGSCVAGFFAFYLAFPWDERVVSLRVSHGDVTRESLGWLQAAEVLSNRLRERVWYRMCIEDPYEDDLNLGRHLSPDKFAFVLSQFVVALGCVVGGRPGRLLLDARATASVALRALLHRLVYEEGLTSMSLAEAREYILSRLDGESLAYYEVQNSLDSLCETLVELSCGRVRRGGGDTNRPNIEERHVGPSNADAGDAAEAAAAFADDDDGAGKACEEAAGGTDVTERLPPPRSLLHDTDEKMKAAGVLGIAVENVPAAVREAYFTACGRAFRTAAECDLLRLHADALAPAWRGSAMGGAEMHLALRNLLPTALRDDAFFEAFVQHPELQDVLRSVCQLQEAAGETVVRKKQLVGVQPPTTAVVRGRNSFRGTCSECGKQNLILWPTNNRATDAGSYCEDCWKVYEAG
ncbi:putative terminal uridylyltransferase 3 [Trypanosoma conorhini]|uniref:RNA uridylyltransferase n=1 Tax=Trypanosoma conorhini TaxID=83891 RepID=A0A422PYW3_9TRYP|nr:putative terminal uridylyltransferase 3 [Trypanosoma conorhini]RNF22912.1 putative terminal uridylyltransferase 3 [Trypanosoma conorhini]